MHGLRSQITGLFRSGFFHVFGAGTVNRILATVLSLVLVRVLSKADYGIYAYAFNIVGFFIIFNGLGAVSALLQICSELYQDRVKFESAYAYGFRSGIKADMAIMLLIILVGLFVPLKIQGSNLLLMVYCVYPFAVLLFELQATRLRVKLENKHYALALNLQSILLVSFSLVGAIAFQAVGLAVGQTASYLLAYAILRKRYPIGGRSPHAASCALKRDYWKIAGVSAVNNGLSQALTLTGTFFVGQFLASDDLVASYQVATLIPFGLLFVPGILMTYAYPYFARNKDDKGWTMRAYAQLSLASILLMGGITLLVCLCAEPLVVLLFGDQYIEVVPVLRVLMIGFFASASFRQPAGNLLVTQRKLGANTAIAILSIIINTAASVFLIPGWGMLGAALSYAITMVVGAIAAIAAYVSAIVRMP